MTLHFYFDVVCPYAYLASTQVDALAEAAGAEVVWHPILLGGVFRALEQPQQVPMAPAKARLNHLDLHRRAERLGVPLSFHPEHPRRTVEAQRLILSAPRAAWPALAKALFRAYWVDNRDVSERAVLAEVAESVGVDAGGLDGARQALFDATAAAVDRGVFGVPTFAIGDRLIWGVDRLHLVAGALGLPRPTPATGEGTGATIAFFHDFSSPFSYLASTRVDAVAARVGARVEWVPFLLGALFREIGTPDVPLYAMSPPRRRWFEQDVADHAAWHGVDYRFPSAFPLWTVTPLRVALLEPAATAAIYRAAWVDDRDIGDREVLAAVLDDAGYDGGALVAATADPAVKARLKANTTRAREIGACGAPTFLVDGEVLFWGQDRLDQVAAAALGWRPRHG